MSRLVIRWSVGIAFQKAILVRFAAMVGGAVALEVFSLSRRQTTFEPFIVPSNGMAPRSSAGTLPDRRLPPTVGGFALLRPRPVGNIEGVFGLRYRPTGRWKLWR